MSSVRFVTWQSASRTSLWRSDVRDTRVRSSQVDTCCRRGGGQRLQAVREEWEPVECQRKDEKSSFFPSRPLVSRAHSFNPFPSNSRFLDRQEATDPLDSPITVPYSEASSAFTLEGERQTRATSANTRRESVEKSREAGGEDRRETDIIVKERKRREEGGLVGWLVVVDGSKGGREASKGRGPPLSASLATALPRWNLIFLLREKGLERSSRHLWY